MIGDDSGSDYLEFEVPEAESLLTFDSKYGLVDDVPSFLGFWIEFSNYETFDMTIIDSLVESTDYETTIYEVENTILIGFRAIIT